MFNTQFAHELKGFCSLAVSKYMFFVIWLKSVANFNQRPNQRNSFSDPQGLMAKRFVKQIYLLLSGCLGIADRGLFLEKNINKSILEIWTREILAPAIVSNVTNLLFQMFNCRRDPTVLGDGRRKAFHYRGLNFLDSRLERVRFLGHQVKGERCSI